MNSRSMHCPASSQSSISRSRACQHVCNISHNRKSTLPSTSRCGHRSCLRGSQRAQAVPTQFTQEEPASTLPLGYTWYETMILLRPDLDEEKRDQELAKFEAYLQRKNALGIDVLVRGNSQALAYPIKGFWDGIYVLYTYAAAAQTAQGVQKLLSTPNSGGELNVLRHMTTKQ